MDDGTAVPLTLPVALTWGNKFPIARDPALFLLLPSKPEGPPLKKYRGWGGGKTLNTLAIGSEKRGNFQFFNLLFQVLSLQSMGSFLSVFVF